MNRLSCIILEKKGVHDQLSPGIVNNLPAIIRNTHPAADGLLPINGARINFQPVALAFLADGGFPNFPGSSVEFLVLWDAIVIGKRAFFHRTIKGKILCIGEMAPVVAAFCIVLVARRSVLLGERQLFSGAIATARALTGLL